MIIARFKALTAILQLLEIYFQPGFFEVIFSKLKKFNIIFKFEIMFCTFGRTNVYICMHVMKEVRKGSLKKNQS